VKSFIKAIYFVLTRHLFLADIRIGPRDMTYMCFKIIFIR
jgi:hypothetical protein